MTRIVRKTGAQPKPEFGDPKKISQAVQHLAQTVKVVVLVEVEPLTDRFIQVIPPADGMRRILDAIENEFPHTGDSINVNTGEVEYYLKDIPGCL